MAPRPLPGLDEPVEEQVAGIGVNDRIEIALVLTITNAEPLVENRQRTPDGRTRDRPSSRRELRGTPPRRRGASDAPRRPSRRVDGCSPRCPASRAWGIRERPARLSTSGSSSASRSAGKAASDLRSSATGGGVPSAMGARRSGPLGKSALNVKTSHEFSKSRSPPSDESSPQDPSGTGQEHESDQCHGQSAGFRDGGGRDLEAVTFGVDRHDRLSILVGPVADFKSHVLAGCVQEGELDRRAVLDRRRKVDPDRGRTASDP